MSTSNQITIPPIEHLRSLSGIKWSRFGPDVVPAWVADMDIRPPDCVIEAITHIVDRADFGYNLEVVEQLPDAFARWQHDNHGWSLDPGLVRRFCDILHGLDTILWHCTAPGDGVVLLTPIYPPFLKALDNAGRRLVDVPLDPDGWRLDPERLRAAVDDRTRVILMCSPHNPTGRVFDRAELEVIAELAIERDLLVISDEVWADIVYPGASHIPLATLGDEIAARTVTLSAASKAFNLAGLRCAVAHVGHAGVAATLDSLPAHLLGAVSTTGAAAAVAAWTSGSDWLQSVRQHLLARRDQLVARLSADLLDVGFQVPEATYLAWLDLRAFGLGDDPTEWLRDEAGVALSSGSDFGVHGNGFARLNFATSAEIVDQLIDRLVGRLAPAVT